MKKKDIEKMVREIKQLCKENQFNKAGSLSRDCKKHFIDFIIKGGNKELLYGYKVCSVFGMRQTDCFNLKF